MPPELSELIFDLLAKDRAARPAAAELLDRANGILEDLPGTSPQALAEHLQSHHQGHFETQKGWRDEASAAIAVTPQPSRSSKKLLLGVGVTMAILGGVLGVFAMTEPEPSARPPVLVAAPERPAQPEEAPSEMLAEPPAEDQAEEAEATPSPRARRRRRRASGTEPSAEPSNSGVETWSWDD